MVEWVSLEAHLRMSSTVLLNTSESFSVKDVTPIRDVTVVAPNDAVPVVDRFSSPKSMSPPSAVIDKSPSPPPLAVLIWTILLAVSMMR